MKIEAYEEIMKDVTADNALEKCTALLALAKQDAVEVEANIVKMTEEMEAQQKKYQDLQVDYIHKFIGASGSADDKDEGDAEAEMAEKLQQMTETIREQMNE